MHIYKGYSHPSTCDYFDTSSKLAISLLTKIHHHLTHSFQIANGNGFQFYGYPVGHHRINGNIRVVMCLLYPPTHYLIEEHLNVTLSMDLNVQLVTILMLMIEKSCPEHLFQHHCCDPPNDSLI